MKETPDLSIIIPAYNEEKRLPPTLERMLRNLKEAFPGSFEIIVMDDGSSDDTSLVVKKFTELHKQVSLITNKKNQGRGFVMRQGVLSARGRYVLDTDADGSVDDEAIPRFYQYMEANNDLDVLIGSRTISGAKILTPQPFLRIALGYIFMFLAWLFFRWRFIDRVNGFKFFRRDTAHDTFKNQYDNTLLAEAEIVFVAERRGWRVKELPVFWTDHRDSRIKPWRESVRSLLGMFKILRHSLRGEYTKQPNKEQR
jgi:dolichyl-phosphate beta-glucosyltransferase